MLFATPCETLRLSNLVRRGLTLAGAKMAVPSNTRIPVENLTRQWQQIEAEIMQAVSRVLPSGKYTLGPELKAFESEFAALCDTRHAIGISSGTAALHLALLACGVGPGD